MATRAYNKASAGNISHQLSGWRGMLDARFIDAWNDLAAQAVEPNPFSESWFLRPALEQFDPSNRSQLFTLWDGDQLCGLMPLSVQPRYGRWPMPHVQNWLHHNAFLGTPLVRAGYEEIFWQAYLAQLDHEPGQALFAHLHCLTIGGALTTALERICAGQKRRCALVQRTERAFLERGLSSEAYLEHAVRGKKRKELRRQKNRLSEEGALTFARDDSATGLGEWMQEFLELERRGWKGGKGSALACADQTRTLFDEILSGAAVAGKLERLDLRLDGKPLAMLVNLLCAPGSFSFKTAFDEDYARFSPGVLLQIENLALLEHTEIAWCDSCAAEGHPMIDSLWTGRRAIGRYSVAIGGTARRAAFGALLSAELAKNAPRNSESQTETGDDA
ncbi:GNAT family N-acetyltransferase [Nostoc sp. CHAB 5834]|nr:GNAT family N-acetyltransferase [Nostoc sp. CHAB 5834]